MKNKLLTKLLMSLVVVSAVNADIYVGLEYGQNFNKDKATASIGNISASLEQDNKYSDIGLRLGFGKDGNWKGQVKFSKITYDKVIFDSSHKDLYEFDFDAIKEFDLRDDVFPKNLYPYVKAGIGYGWMTVTGYSDSSIKEYSLNAGVGLSYKVAEHFYMNGGVDYVYRNWQDVLYGSVNVDVTGSGAKIYIGANYAF